MSASLTVNVVKRLKPAHLLVIRLFWGGKTYVEIAQATGYTTQNVMNIVHSEEAEEILSQLQNASLDSMSEVREAINDAAPEIVNEQIRLALRSPDDRVRAVVGKELLHMAGHVPVKRVEVEVNPIHDKYKGLSEEQLRQRLLESFTPGRGSGGASERGPDGNPLQ